MRTDPETKAKSIASHTCAVLRQMRGEMHLKAHRERYSAWLDFAAREGVCNQIRDVMRSAAADTEREIKAASVPMTSASRRMTGEHQEAGL